MSVLADPSRRDRFEAEGFILNGERMDFPLLPTRRRSRAGEEQDLIILAVKNHQLERAIADMAPYVGEILDPLPAQRHYERGRSRRPPSGAKRCPTP